MLANPRIRGCEYTEVAGCDCSVTIELRFEDPIGIVKWLLNQGSHALVEGMVEALVVAVAISVAAISPVAVVISAVAALSQSRAIGQRLIFLRAMIGRSRC
jgi:hypothetical protein